MIMQHFPVGHGFGPLNLFAFIGTGFLDILSLSGLEKAITSFEETLHSQNNRFSMHSTCK